MKKNILVAAVAAGAITTGVAFAHDLPGNVPHPNKVDIQGDSLINLPAHGTTVPSKSVDVWFVQIPEATGYSVDLVGGGVIGGAAGIMTNVCGTVTTSPGDAENRFYQMRTVLDAASLDCGSETSETKSGDGDVRGLHLCKYTLPDLANGSYALAINPVVAGGTVRSQQEYRNAATCGTAVTPRDATVNELTGVSLASVAGNDTLGYLVNSLSARSVATGLMPMGAGVNINHKSPATPGSPLSADTFYQRFAVADASPAPTMAPSKLDPVHPVNGASLSTGGGGTGGINNYTLEWHDPSGVAGAANWYEIWIYDKNGARIDDLRDDNPSFKNWYKITVDPALSCTSFTSSTSNRICTVSLNMGSVEPKIATALAAANNNDKFYWYVRGYNDQFQSGPWSGYGMFRK